MTIVTSLIGMALSLSKTTCEANIHGNFAYLPGELPQTEVMIEIILGLWRAIKSIKERGP